MDVISRYEGDVLVISLSGEMDHHNLMDIKLKTDPLIIEYRPRLLLLDLSKVPFCDSSGIAAVIGRYKLARSLGAQTVLHGLTPQVRKVLSLGGVLGLVKEVVRK